MNPPFLEKASELLLWILRDPIVDMHLWIAGGLVLLAGIVVLMKTSYALDAGNSNFATAGLVTVLGAVLFLLGMTLAEQIGRPNLPEMLPMIALAGAVVLVLLVLVVGPLTKLILKCGYLAALCSWGAALLCGVLVVFAVDFGFNAFGPKMARLVSHKGTVNYRLAPEKPWVAITKKRLALPVNSEVNTTTNSTATFDLDGGGFIGLRPATLVRIRAVGPAATVELEQGRVVGSVKHTASTKFQIRTPAASTGILGTQFLVDSDAQKNTTVTVAEGSVGVTGAAPGSPTAKVNAGQAVSVPAGGAPGPVRAGDPADLKLTTDFGSAVSDAMKRRNREIEELL